MIEGAIRVLKQGITEPDSVKVSTNEYRFEEDHITKFIEDCVVANPASMVSAQELLSTYNKWCSLNGETAVSMTPFLRELRMRMPISPQRGGGGRRMYAGIYLYNIGGTEYEDHY
jgi:phage/plasmid-associated DNA primase